MGGCRMMSLHEDRWEVSLWWQNSSVDSHLSLKLMTWVWSQDPCNGRRKHSLQLPLSSTCIPNTPSPINTFYKKKKIHRVFLQKQDQFKNLSNFWAIFIQQASSPIFLGGRVRFHILGSNWLWSTSSKATEYSQSWCVSSRARPQSLLFVVTLSLHKEV